MLLVATGPMAMCSTSTTADTPMWHASVRKAMLSARPRLTVILTDSCSSQRGLTDLSIGPDGLSPYARQVLRSLLLNHTGLVDMNSSSLGQKSSCNPETGSDFTYALFKTISFGNDEDLDIAPRDGVVSWTEVFQVTRSVVARRSEWRQVPEAYSLARPR